MLSRDSPATAGIVLSAASARRRALLRPKRGAVPFGAALIGACSLAAPAAAQVRPPTIEGGVTGRVRPEYDPAGIGVGNFILSPRLSLDLSYDDNVYRTSSAKRDDLFATIHPGVTLESRSPRYPLMLKADATIRRYARTETEDSTQYDFAGAGAAEVASGTTLTATGGYARKVEPRGSAGDLFIGGTPISYNLLRGSVGAGRDAGRIAIEIGGDFARFDYRTATIGGIRTSQRFRDYRQRAAYAKAAYGIGPGIAAFVRASVDRNTYAIDTIDRSSRGYNILGGVQFGISRLLVGSAGIGYLHENFADPVFGDISGFDYDLSLQWNPTELISVSVKGARSLQNSPFVGSAGGIQSNVAIGVDYELLRKLILSSTMEYSRETFRGIDRRDRRFDAQLGGRYLLSRLIGVSVALNYRHQASAGPGARDYRGFGATFGVTIRR